MVFICYLMKIAIDGIYLLSTKDSNDWYLFAIYCTENSNGICLLSTKDSND